MARRPRPFLRPAIDAATPEIVAAMARVARETGLSADDVIANMRRFGAGLPLPDRIIDGTADRRR